MYSNNTNLLITSAIISTGVIGAIIAYGLPSLTISETKKKDAESLYKQKLFSNLETIVENDEENSDNSESSEKQSSEKQSSEKNKKRMRKNSSKNSTKSARRRKYSTTSVLSNSSSAENSESVSSAENSESSNSESDNRESSNIENCENREKSDSADKPESRNNSNNLEDSESDKLFSNFEFSDTTEQNKDQNEEQNKEQKEIYIENKNQLGGDENYNISTESLNTEDVNNLINNSTVDINELANQELTNVDIKELYKNNIKSFALSESSELISIETDENEYNNVTNMIKNSMSHLFSSIQLNTQPSNIHSVLIGCNYAGTPYEVNNCIQNTDIMQNLINIYEYDKIKFAEPCIVTDNNDLPDILQTVTQQYEKCKDNDAVLVYYSGYCDKDTENELDYLTLACKDKNPIAIDDIVSIVKNEKIRLIIIIDGFFSDKLYKPPHFQKNHLIVSSSVDDQASPIDRTEFTKKFCKIIENHENYDFESEIWNNVQFIGERSLLVF